MKILNIMHIKTNQNKSSKDHFLLNKSFAISLIVIKIKHPFLANFITRLIKKIKYPYFEF
uniref:Uncharacterized protein n=1 Tax=Staphylococcus aureus TaxID=1280 RepID=A0A811ANI9_STAAU|nr:hypothetical protein [Staphylococcus aureus]BDX51520.1 hypothetical protein [Staphylococcus aureus]